MKIPWLVRLCVSAALLAGLLCFVPLGELWQAVREVPPGLWLAVLGLFLLGHVLAAGKWWWLTSRQTPVPFGLSLRAHFTGLVTNLCLPGIAGGDVVRAVYVMGRAERREGVAVASLADRLLDTLALLLLAGTGALMVSELSGAAVIILLSVAGVILVAVIALAGVYLRLRRRSPDGVRGRIATALRVLVRRPGVLAGTLGLSLAIQGSFVLLNLWLGSAAGVDCPAAAWFLAWPLAKLVALAPVSLAGLGVREAALVAFLVPFGGIAAEVTAAGLLWQAILATGGLVGCLLLVPLRTSQPEPIKEPATA